MTQHPSTPLNQIASPVSIHNRLEVIDFGLSDYTLMWEHQKKTLQQRIDGNIPDTLLMGEHPAVITKGRGTQEGNLLVTSPDIPIVAIERGGDITYHAPGQLVVYPIIQLPDDRRDLHRYLRDLEDVLMRVVADFGITGQRNDGYSGVWTETSHGLKKLASIGVAVKKWTTYHGIALNVSTDLQGFSQINPCNMQSDVMTSLHAESEAKQQPRPPMEEVKASFIKAFCGIF